MSGISAALLTMGEKTTERARASIVAQNHAPQEILTVRGVAPYHRAFNEAARRAQGKFLIAVDADMILDPNCFGELYRNAALHDHVAEVVGHLNDPILGRIQGIKLFRTKSLRTHPFPDSISSDADFARSLGSREEALVYALNFARDPRHTFGEHRPDYTPAYTFGRFFIQGVRHRYRKAMSSLRGLAQILARSSHPQAPTALIASCHGAFFEHTRDYRLPYENHPDFAVLHAFQTSGEASARTAAPPPPLLGEARTDYEAYLDYGHRLVVGADFPSFWTKAHELAQSDAPQSWIALLALCHSIFVSGDATRSEREVDLDPLLP